MSFKKTLLNTLLLILLNINVLFASTTDITFIFQGGILDSGDNFHDKDYDMGFLFGGEALIPLGKLEQFKGVVDLSYAMANNEEVLSDKTRIYDSESEFSAITLLSMLRYSFFTRGDVKLFVQAGCGVSYEKKVLKMTPNANSFDSGTDTDISFGFAYGGGIRATRHFEITILNRSFNNDAYLTTTLGFVFQ